MKDYDDYSLYGASHVYLRLINPRQFLPEEDAKSMPRIKSVLNFIKHILYPLKVNYQKQTLNELFRDKYNESDQRDNIKTNFSIECYNKDFISIDIENYLQSLPKIIKKFLKDTPYYKDKVMTKHLYMSCLITLLRNITLSNHNKNKIENRIKNEYRCKDSLFNDMQEEEALNAPITFRLDNSYKEYIRVLNNQLKTIIIKDIREILKYYDLSEDIIQDILFDNIEEIEEDE